MIIARKSVMGQEDLVFFMSASVRRSAPLTSASELDKAVFHAILFGFSRLKPARSIFFF